MTPPSVRKHPKFESVIGLEIHCQLALDSKLFSSVSRSGVDEVTLALPGTLPVLNERAVDLGILLGLALGCQIPRVSEFARKNYFYPDLPKGYQITQFDRPLCLGGGVVLSTGTKVHLDRIQIEEDAGKTIHGQGKSLVDFSRAGVGLLEIVSRPDMRSAVEAGEYMRRLHRLAVYYGVTDGDLEKGNFRADANVSIRPWGESQLGTRTELKNINSFRFLERAISIEIERQIELIESGGSVSFETRGYDAAMDRTFRMRSKEDSHDYRYFPEPDLPPLRLSDERIGRAQVLLTKEPWLHVQDLMKETGLSQDDAESLTKTRESFELYRRVCARLSSASQKLAGSFLSSILYAERTLSQESSSPEFAGWLAEAIDAVASGDVSLQILKEHWQDALAHGGGGLSFRAWSEAKGLLNLRDDALISSLVEELVAEYPSQAAELVAGKAKVLSFFIGQAMKRTQGAVDVAVFRRTLSEVLGLQPELH